jgi:hypothetical protein
MKAQMAAFRDAHCQDRAPGSGCMGPEQYQSPGKNGSGAMPSDFS